MTTAIKLNSKICFIAEKIYDESAKRNLPAKLKTTKISVS